MKILIIISIFACMKISYAQESLTQQLINKKNKSSAKMPSHIKEDFSRALKQLKDGGIEKSAIKNGKAVPTFKVNNKPFKSYYSIKPVVLKFYRGSWCPYCQLEMRAYEKFKSQIENKGYQLIVLTLDSEIEIKKFRIKQNISFGIYQDKNNAIAKKFGISFKLDNKVAEIYKQFGINLSKSQNNNLGELPLPGTYIINTKGIICGSLD